MALRGIKVLELAGLAPGPFCGMVLADFGASVIRIDKIFEEIDFDCLANGKQSIAVNLKHEKGIQIFFKLCKTADVVIDTYRPGVLESLGIGPKVLLKENPRLIYARLSGYGQYGRLAKRAGHDVNYVALTGLLSLMRRSNEKPRPPINILGDFGGGGLMCALGIAMALIERHSSGKGQVIDCNIVEGTSYLSSWIYRSQTLPIWGNTAGGNILDGGMHFYETYETKDGKFMAVGAIEPKFYAELLKGLGLSEEQCPQFGDRSEVKNIFIKRFLEKTQQEWNEIFMDIDACVTPILSLEEATEHPHNKERNTFVPGSDTAVIIPAPAPKLSRTPAESHAMNPKLMNGAHTEVLLKSLNYSEQEISAMESEGVIFINRKSKM